MYFPEVMFSAAGAVARWIAPFRTVTAVAVVGLLANPVHTPAVRLADDANPLAALPFYVNPSSAAMRAAQHAEPPSPELTSVANTPQAHWIVPGSSAATVAKYTGDAQAAGAMPVLTLYGIPHRDCGSFAAGGMATADDYRAWIDGIANDLGASRTAIIVEPDALAMADCLSSDERQERYDLIRYAVDTLTRNPAMAVYVDAGHLRWHSADDMAARLNKAVDVARARVSASTRQTSSQQATKSVTAKQFRAHQRIVPDRHVAQRRRPSTRLRAQLVQPRWPALGAAPTASTGGAHADAYLWIKRPGDSDGSCGKVIRRPGPS